MTEVPYGQTFVTEAKKEMTPPFFSVIQTAPDSAYEHMKKRRNIYENNLSNCEAPLVMAGAIAAIRKNRTISEEETDEESLLDHLISRVPPQETWDAEFCLGMLVAG